MSTKEKRDKAKRKQPKPNLHGPNSPTTKQNVWREGRTAEESATGFPTTEEYDKSQRGQE